MRQTRKHMAQIIADKTLKSGISKNLAREIAAYLLHERRVGELDSLVRDVQEARAEAGIVEVVASSAHDLTPDVKSHIQSEIKRIYPKAKKIVISEVHDPSLVGGVRLSLANQQLDISVRASLNKFKQLAGSGKV